MAKGKNGKAKKNAPKPKKTPGRRPGGNTTMPAARRVSTVPRMAPRSQGHLMATCSITDPFCVHARGAQRPDGGPPTIPYQLRGVLTMLANGTTGATRYVFVPNMLFQYNSAVLAVTTWTNSAAWIDMGGAAFISANAKEIRLTSFGIVVRSAMTATSAKGLVIMSTDPAPVVSGTYTLGSMQATESTVTTLAAGFEHSWVSKPMGASAHLFRPIADFTTTMSNFDWTSLVVEVNGSDTTTGVPFLTCEIVMNVEFTVQSGQTGTAIAQLQKTPPVPNRTALAAAEHGTSQRPSFIQGGIDAATSYLEKSAKASLNTLLSEGMSALTLLL